MGIQLNGTSGTDVISAVDGSLTVEGLTISGDFNIADKIIHSGDTNTAIRFPAADTITAETAGSERLRIDSDGHVRVGSGDPTYEFELVGAGSQHILIGSTDANAATLVLDGDSNGDGTGSDYATIMHSTAGNLEYHNRKTADHIFKIGTSNEEKLRITSGGQVRIGNENNIAAWGQNNRLQVAGTDWSTSGITIAKLADSGSVPNLVFGVSRGTSPGTAITNGDRLGYISFTGDDGNDIHTVGAAIVSGTDAGPSSNSISGTLQFYTGGNQTSNERLRITSTGKVCINNDTALSDLHVCTAGSSEQDGTLRLGGTNAELGLVLDYDQASATTSRITANPTYTNTSALLKICVDGDANPNQLVLKGDGRIGIGTQNPASKLHVHAASGDCFVTTKGGTNQGMIVRAGDNTLRGYFGNAGGVSLGAADTALAAEGILHILAGGTATTNEKIRVNVGYAGSVDIKGIPASLRLYSQRDTSDWDSTDPIGKLDFYVGDDTTNNLPYNAGFIHCLNETDNAGEPSGALVFGTTTANLSGGAIERVRIASGGQMRVNPPAANGGSSLLEKQALIGAKHIYTAYHNFSSTNSDFDVDDKIKTNSCGELWVIGGWANGNGLRMKKYTWVASGDTSIVEQSNTFASRYGVGITLNTPTMSISGDYVNFNFTFSDNQGSKMEKLKIHFEYFHQFRVDA